MYLKIKYYDLELIRNSHTQKKTSRAVIKLENRMEERY